MTPDRLRDTIIAALIRRHGGTNQTWRAVIGRIKVYDRADYPHCNWSIEPCGTPVQSAAIETLLDRLRLEHPIVSAG